MTETRRRAEEDEWGLVVAHLAFRLSFVSAVQERKAVGNFDSGASHTAEQGTHHAVLKVDIERRARVRRRLLERKHGKEKKTKRMGKGEEWISSNGCNG